MMNSSMSFLPCPKLLLGNLCVCLSLLDWKFERCKGNAIAVSLHQKPSQHSVFLCVSESMEKTGNWYWLLTSSLDILGRFFEKFGCNTAVRNTLTDLVYIQLSVSHMTRSERSIRIWWNHMKSIPDVVVIIFAAIITVMIYYQCCYYS